MLQAIDHCMWLLGNLIFAIFVFRSDGNVWNFLWHFIQSFTNWLTTLYLVVLLKGVFSPHSMLYMNVLMLYNQAMVSTNLKTDISWSFNTCKTGANGIETHAIYACFNLNTIMYHILNLTEMWMSCFTKCDSSGVSVTSLSAAKHEIYVIPMCSEMQRDTDRSCV